MQNMLALCDNFASEYNVVFHAKKFVLQLMSYSFSYFYHYAPVLIQW